MNKPTRDNYFMKIALVSAERSTCFSEAKGAILVKNNRIVSTGYNGAPSGVPSCRYEENECRKRKLGYGHGQGHHECKAVHAEVNAILNAGINGISTRDCILYCTHKPCEECSKIIINSGIRKIFYLYDYESEFATWLLKEAKVEINKMDWEEN